MKEIREKSKHCHFQKSVLFLIRSELLARARSNTAMFFKHGLRSGSDLIRGVFLIPEFSRIVNSSLAVLEILKVG